MIGESAVEVKVCIMAVKKGDLMWRLVRAVTIAAIILSAGCGVTQPPRMDSAVRVADAVQPCAPLGTAYMRTTLYFGLARPTGMVSEAEWPRHLPIYSA